MLPEPPPGPEVRRDEGTRGRTLERLCPTEASSAFIDSNFDLEADSGVDELEQRADQLGRQQDQVMTT